MYLSLPIAKKTAQRLKHTTIFYYNAPEVVSLSCYRMSGNARYLWKSNGRYLGNLYLYSLTSTPEGNLWATTSWLTSSFRILPACSFMLAPSG